VHVPAEHESGTPLLDRTQHPPRSDSAVDVPLRWRVHQQHSSRRQPGEHALGVLLVRSKLQSQGATGTPPPSPKNVTSSISATSPWSTLAACQPAHAAHSASSVLLLPGTSSAGRSIALKTPIMP
jgi:hypothetical protein